LFEAGRRRQISSAAIESEGEETERTALIETDEYGASQPAEEGEKWAEGLGVGAGKSGDQEG
jgi:hypothetical protein